MSHYAVTFESVEVVQASAFGMTCRIAGQTVIVGPTIPEPGTTVKKAGDVGRLVLPRWFVLREELPISSGEQR